MKVTSVEVQKKNPHRFNIFLDGQFAFGADEDLVVERRLVVGKVIESQDLEKILFEAEIGKLMERMYGLLNLRQRSEKEIRDYWRIKNLESRIKGKQDLSQLVVDAVVEHLKRKGLLNDREFAKAWVEARRKSKQKGKIALKQELFQKGIDREIIEEVLGDELGVMSQSEEDLARQALEKKWKNWERLPYLEKKKKMYEFLMRRGFEYSVVREVVEKFLEKS